MDESKLETILGKTQDTLENILGALCNTPSRADKNEFKIKKCSSDSLIGKVNKLEKIYNAINKTIAAKAQQELAGGARHGGGYSLSGGASDIKKLPSELLNLMILPENDIDNISKTSESVVGFDYIDREEFKNMWLQYREKEKIGKPKLHGSEFWNKHLKSMTNTTDDIDKGDEADGGDRGEGETRGSAGCVSMVGAEHEEGRKHACRVA